MAKKLTSIAWDELKDEMSMAGNPVKIATVSKHIHSFIIQKIDTKNIPELVNMQYGLKKVIAELKALETKERKRQRVIKN